MAEGDLDLGVNVKEEPAFLEEEYGYAPSLLPGGYFIIHLRTYSVLLSFNMI